MSDAATLEVRGVVVGLFQTNCWVVGSRQRGEGVVIDPGEQPGEILALAREMGVRITRVLATHAHLDHVIAARAVVEATDAPFLMHPHDYFIARKLPETTLRWMGQAAEPPPDATEIGHGDDLEVAGMSLRVLHVPGHTPGSVAFYAEGADLLFSGDTLFREAVGRWDLEGGDGPRLIRSIRQQLLTLPGSTRVLPGHMAETTIRHERARNPFLQKGMALE